MSLQSSNSWQVAQWLELDVCCVGELQAERRTTRDSEGRILRNIFDILCLMNGMIFANALAGVEHHALCGALVPGAVVVGVDAHAQVFDRRPRLRQERLRLAFERVAAPDVERPRRSSDQIARA